jgi:mRNA interferase RelE/StbE
LDKYKIAETEQFQKKVGKKKYKNLYKKINDYVYPLLRKNPYFGANIKKLKGEFAGLYRYRIGKYRLFYEIDNDKIIVFIVDIEDRK